MGSKSKTLKNGQRVGLTRNQQRKLDYSAEAAKASRGAAKEGAGSAPSKSKMASRTNHSPGPGKNGGNHGQQAQEKKQRRVEAEARQAVHDKLSTSEKIAELDRVLGKGQGASRERARLNKLLAPKPVFIAPAAATALAKELTDTLKAAKPAKRPYIKK